MGKMLEDPEQKEWANAIHIVYPTFEGGGTHVNVSGMAMTKAAPHKEAALKLMEFLSSDAAQKIYAKTTRIPRQARRRTLCHRRQLGDFTPDGLNLTELAKLRPAALRIMEEVNFDG